jgi:hypothetical protein
MRRWPGWTRGCPVAPLRRPRAILFPKGYRVTATGSVWTGPVGAADACVHPHAQHRLRNGQSLPCQPGFGWKTPASIAWRTSAIRSSPRSFVLLNRSSPSDGSERCQGRGEASWGNDAYPACDLSGGGECGRRRGDRQVSESTRLLRRVDESYNPTLRFVGAVLDLQGANSRPAG